MSADIIHNLTTGQWAVIVAACLSLVQIAPIKINPWSWIGKCIGKCINGEVIKEVFL